MSQFSTTFEALTGHAPFPWQEALYEQFIVGKFPDTCLLPTGLGKTSVIAVWLIALGQQPDIVPRRLVYIVNRRTVVDQTTTEVKNFRKNLSQCSGLEALLRSLCAMQEDADGQPISPLALSTLRGQFADNQEWSADPARPAVICGTVDMIGSRLLFNGYRCGYKSRPLQAGFLGQHSLLIHDEAHLEPAFQKLLEAIHKEQIQGRFPDQQPLRVIELSATARGTGTAFRLSDEDRKDSTVKKRLNAPKQLTLHPVESDKKPLAEELTRRALSHQESGQAVLVFTRGVETMEHVADGIRKGLKKTAPQGNVVTLSGTMRGYERENLIKTAVFQRFLERLDKETAKSDETVYLICTSAGEVGVNISADHLVCDLSTFESMAQRFGRVNRFGENNNTQVVVLYPSELPSEEDCAAEMAKDKSKRKMSIVVDAHRRRTLELLKQLNGDVSPHKLGGLDQQLCQQAYSPAPEILPISDILFDAWTLTTVRNSLPGRPPIDEFLHGVADWEPAQTQVAWRDEVQELSEDLLNQLGLTPKELLDDYPIKPHEILTDRTERIFERLKTLNDRWEDGFVWTIDSEDDVEIRTLPEIIKNGKDRFNARTILLPPSAGGLSGGLFEPARTAAADVSDQWFDEQDRPRRQRLWDDEAVEPNMRLVRVIDTDPGGEREEREAEEESDTSQPRRWMWYVRPGSADDDGSRTSSRSPITWKHHVGDVVRNAERIAAALLPESSDLVRAIVLAARFHDHGKRRIVWQRSIGNPRPAEPPWYAKSGIDTGTSRSWIPLYLSRYRHEFGSLLDLLHPDLSDRDEFAGALQEFETLTVEMQDVVLHLIAVHHGRGRPHFPADEAFDPIRSQALADELAAEVPRRFARLQRQYGRWGLAWLESLLRAADSAASNHPSVATPEEMTKEAST